MVPVPGVDNHKRLYVAKIEKTQRCWNWPQMLTLAVVVSIKTCRIIRNVPYKNGRFVRMIVCLDRTHFVFIIVINRPNISPDPLSFMSDLDRSLKFLRFQIVSSLFQICL